jgi:hypothetical protein
MDVSIINLLIWIGDLCYFALIIFKLYLGSVFKIDDTTFGDGSFPLSIKYVLGFSIVESPMAICVPILDLSLIPALTFDVLYDSLAVRKSFLERSLIEILFRLVHNDFSDRLTAFVPVTQIVHLRARFNFGLVLFV